MSIRIVYSILIHACLSTDASHNRPSHQSMPRKQTTHPHKILPTVLTTRCLVLVFHNISRPRDRSHTIRSVWPSIRAGLASGIGSGRPSASVTPELWRNCAHFGSTNRPLTDQLKTHNCAAAHLASANLSPSSVSIVPDTFALRPLMLSNLVRTMTNWSSVRAHSDVCE